MNKSVQVASAPWVFTVVVEPDEEDGGYVVHCPTLKGCWSQGDTIEEALHNIADAISGWLTVHIERSLDTYLRNTQDITEPLTLEVQIP